MDVRVRALQTVLAQKGYIDPAALDVLIDTYQTKIGPRNGARVVAAPGSIPRSANGCSTTRPRPSRRSATPAARAST